VDTGMGRIGVPHDGPVLQLAAAVLAHPHLRLEGLMTHLASADDLDGSSAERQWSIFLDVVETLRRQGVQVPFVHGANSAATLRWPGMHGDQVRVGLALYGTAPGPGPADLHPALTVRSAVAQVKHVGPGFAVGYGETFRTKAPAVLVTVPIGYADGYRRALSNQGEALIAGLRARVAGRVSMDQTVFVLPDGADVRVGDEVVLLGQGPGGAVTAADWAAWADTIPYEVFCGLSARVPRVYRIGAEIRHQGAIDANFWAGL
jgi:alanine racemase